MLRGAWLGKGAGRWAQMGRAGWQMTCSLDAEGEAGLARALGGDAAVDEARGVRGAMGAPAQDGVGKSERCGKGWGDMPTRPLCTGVRRNARSNSGGALEPFPNN